MMFLGTLDVLYLWNPGAEAPGQLMLVANAGSHLTSSRPVISPATPFLRTTTTELSQARGVDHSTVRVCQCRSDQLPRDLVRGQKVESEPVCHSKDGSICARIGNRMVDTQR
jgi:hypothetical protein